MMMKLGANLVEADMIKRDGSLMLGDEEVEGGNEEGGRGVNL